MNQNTTVRLDDTTRAKLDELAATLDRSRAWLINEAIRQYLDHQSWMLEKIDEGIEAADRGELIPHADAMAKLDGMIVKRASRGRKA